MHWSSAIYAIPSLITAGISFGIALFTWKQKSNLRNIFFVLLMAATAQWASSRAMEALAVGIQSKIFWAKIEYLGISSIAPLWVLFTSQFRFPPRKWTSIWLVVIWIVPLLTLGAVFTNDQHHLFWSAIAEAPGSDGVLLVYSHGPLFWQAAVYNYLLLLLGSLNLVQNARRPQPALRKQSWSLLAAAAIPWLGNLVYLLGWSPIHGMDLTPFAFTLSGLVILISIYEYRLFRLAPMARDLMIEQMREGVLVLDGHDRVVDLNPAARALLQISSQPPVGVYFKDLLSAENQAIQAFLDRGHTHGELCIGREPSRILEVRVSPVDDQEGNTPSRLIIIHDVTDRMRAEDQLKESEKKYRQLIETLQEGVWVIDRDNLTTYVNPYVARLLGYSEEEMLGKPVYSFMDEANSAVAQENTEQRKQGISGTYDLELIHKDGHPVQVRIGATPMLDETGQYQGSIGAIMDISERRKIERQLSEALDLNQKIINVSSVGFLVYKASGQCVLVNQAAARIVNASIDQLLAQDFRKLASWQQSGLCAAAEKALESGEPQQGEFHFITSFGKEVWLDGFFAPFSTNGEPHLLLLANDFTERKLTQEALRQSEKRFHSLVESMDDQVFTLDQDQRHTGVFGRYLEKAKLSPELFLGKTLVEILGEPAAAAHVEANRRALNGETVVYEWAAPGPDGERYFQTSLSPIQADQEIVGIVGVGRDITELKRLEKELEETKVLLEAAFEQTPIPMVLSSSPDHVLRIVNTACLNFWGISRGSSPVGQIWLEWEPPFELFDNLGNPIPIEEGPLAKSLRGESAHGWEVRVAFPGGYNRWELASASPIYNRQGEQIAGLVVFPEITGRKRIEEEERKQRKLAEALRDTAAAVNQTVELDEVLDRILANIDRVVPHDSANIGLIEDEELIRFVRSIGDAQAYKEFENKNRTIHIGTFPNLKRMAETGEPVIVKDTHKDPEWVGKSSQFVRSYLGTPIFFKQRILGFINLHCSTPDFFTETHAETLKAFANDAAVAVENARLYSEVQRISIQDELTGVYNYRGLLVLGQREFDRARRFARGLAALFLDIDHFRNFNNLYSHEIGNRVLREVAHTCRSTLRAVDLIARYGGEEFVILLPEADAGSARQVAERLRERIEATLVETQSGRLGVTASIGIAQLTPGMVSLTELLEEANQAEHTAKQRGRNQVIAAGEG